jgi:hypothetical protein
VNCNLEYEYWHEVKEETTTKSSQLPKLTIEVFDRPDCPEWAKYAVVDVQGLAYWYQYPPLIDERIGCWKTLENKRQMIDGFFDKSDWQNSLIEHPAKEKALPDWCKAGKYVYDVSLREYIYVREEDYDWYIDPIARGRIKQAHKRPFSAEEMQGMVGKMLDVASVIELIVGYNKCTKEIITYDDTYSAERLMGATGWRIDGKPCFKLEHLNDKGEWVE